MKVLTIRIPKELESRLRESKEKIKAETGVEVDSTSVILRTAIRLFLDCVDSGEYKRIQAETSEYKRIQTNTKEYKRIQTNTPEAEGKRELTLKAPVCNNNSINTYSSNKRRVNKRKSSVAKAESSEEQGDAEKLAAKFFGGLIKQYKDSSGNIPNRLVKLSSRQKSSWIKVFDLMIRKDGLSVASIDQMIEWVRQDDFWSTVILSPRKLRDKWLQLEAQRQRSNKSKFIKNGFEETNEEKSEKDETLFYVNNGLKSGDLIELERVKEHYPELLDFVKEHNEKLAGI